MTQLQRHHDPDHYIYQQNVSKTSDGSFKKLRVKSITIPIYACPEVGERCPVYILDRYLSKLPRKAIECDLIYLCTLPQVPTDPSAPWYAAALVGRDTLQNKLKTTCKEAGITHNISNHSLRAASATQMYGSRIPEKIIQERTGHRSLEALRMYKRTNQLQRQAVSAVLSAPSTKTSYNKYIESQKMTLSHTVCQTKQPNLENFMFQSLHGCTININSAPRQSNTPTITLRDHAGRL